MDTNSKRPTRLQKYKKKSRKTKEVLTDKAKSLIKGDDQAPVADARGRITNETVAQHREEVLKGAKRFIYPLQHSKHRIAIFSGIIAGLALITVTVFSALILYRYQNTGTFAYNITKILPLPVAKVDGHFVSYEEYLFELRHNMHFKRTQEGVDFSTDDGKRELAWLKQQAFEYAKNNTVVQELAKQNGVNVNEQEIDAQIDLIRNKGASGQSLEALENTLREFYDWSLNDWKRVLRAQLLRQKLVPKLDTDTFNQAEQVLQQVEGGTDFAQLAKQVSEDELTKNDGGKLGVVSQSDTQLPAPFIAAAFSIEQGGYSNLVETIFKDNSGRQVVGIHIIKVDKIISEQEREVSHILFLYDDIDATIQKYKDEHGVTNYINV